MNKLKTSMHRGVAEEQLQKMERELVTQELLEMYYQRKVISDKSNSATQALSQCQAIQKGLEDHIKFLKEVVDKFDKEENK